MIINFLLTATCWSAKGISVVNKQKYYLWAKLEMQLLPFTVGKKARIRQHYIPCEITLRRSYQSDGFELELLWQLSEKTEDLILKKWLIKWYQLWHCFWCGYTHPCAKFMILNAALGNPSQVFTNIFKEISSLGELLLLSVLFLQIQWNSMNHPITWHMICLCKENSHSHTY